MEQIYKLQPDRTIALRGFDSFAASAALHSATDNGFQVSGTFRDPSDFAVLMLYDADNFYEHPSIKYLPDFDFSGLVLNFNVEYSDGVQPLDSIKFNWIDWATLDVVLPSVGTSRIKLWDNAMLAGGSFTPASGIFTLSAGAGGPQTGDRITLWFENFAFDYIVPAQQTSVEYPFYGGNPGAAHTITVNSNIYSYTEPTPDGAAGADVANGLIAAVNAGSGDLDVVASAGSVSNAVLLTVQAAAPDASINLTASDGNAPALLGQITLAAVASALCDEINVANPSKWVSTGNGLSILATSNDANISIQAARHGFASCSGATVTWSQGPQNPDGSYSWSDKFPGLNPGDSIWLNGVQFAIASVDSPVQLTLAAAPENALLEVPYVAPRGGSDGNMFTLYSLAEAPDGTSAPNLTTQPSLQLTGGTSDVIWNVSIDFTALGIDQLRQCWFTYAPSLTNGTAYSDTDWTATYTNWSVSGDDSKKFLKIAGPGSVRIEETSSWCTFQGTGWAPPPGETGFFSKYAAAVSSKSGDSVTVSYQCGQTHDLYVGTSLYTDRATVAVTLDGAALPALNCYLNTGSAVNTRRLLASSLAAGSHTVTLTSNGATYFYFDFLEAAVRSDWPGPARTFTQISPAIDYDTDHTYKLSPARLMWIFDQLGFAGPMNEYLGVFWWNQRTGSGAVFPQTTVTFDGTWIYNDSIFVTANGTTMGKTVFPEDTNQTIASHFAWYINEVFQAVWASASDNVLTITSRSTTPDYALTVTASRDPSGSSGTVTVGPAPASGVPPLWMIDTTKAPTLTRSVMDWHSDFYAQCAQRSLEVTTAGSMELVLPPVGFAAIFPDANQTPVTTDTGFGSLLSTQCAVGNTSVIAYQEQFYKTVADLQSGAGLNPSLQFGEFLWWFFPGPQATNPSGMAYYDPQTTAAAQTALGRPLHVFRTQNDDPSINNYADAMFLRNRLRDHVSALVTFIRGYYPNAKLEVLFPYDVNYPQPVDGSSVGGKLNNYVNLPVEWEQQSTSGLDRMKVEALQFSTQFRSLDLANQAINLMPNYGWPRSAVRYLVPLTGVLLFLAWQTEVGLAFSAGLNAVNLWAFDHLNLYNLDLANLREP